MLGITYKRHGSEMATHYLAANVFYKQRNCRHQYNLDRTVRKYLERLDFAKVGNQKHSQRLRNARASAVVVPWHNDDTPKSTIHTPANLLCPHMATGVNGITTTPGSPQDFPALCKNSPDFPTELRAFICQPESRWTKSKQRKKS